MRRRTLLVLAAILTVQRAFAQRVAPKRIAYFGAGSAANDAPWLASFRKGMQELGWTPGRDYIMEERHAHGLVKDWPRLAGELLAWRPDLILTPSESTLPPLIERTQTIPIVFAQASDPVGLGFVKTLHRPGGNVTGLTNLSGGLAAKRLQILKEAFPDVVHVGIIYEPEFRASATQARLLEEAGVRLKLKTTLLPFKAAAEVGALAERAAAAGVDAYAGTTGPLLTIERAGVLRQIAATGRPAIFAVPAWVDAGGLMAYGISADDNFRRSAIYVDKILKGAKPGDLPIEEPTQFVLAVHRGTAKRLGLAIPPSILMRANRIIE